MNTRLQDTIKEELNKLQKENREAVDSLDWIKISEEIIKKYSTEEEKINTFQLETFLVLVGLVEDEEKYKENLEKNILLKMEEIQKIVKEVKEKIFFPVYYYLIENIKGSLPKRSIHWQQNLDFILSGGDYTAFIRRVENQTNNNSIPVNQNLGNSSKMNDLRDNFTI